MHSLTATSFRDSKTTWTAKLALLYSENKTNKIAATGYAENYNARRLNRKSENKEPNPWGSKKRSNVRREKRNRSCKIRSAGITGRDSKYLSGSKMR